MTKYTEIDKIGPCTISSIEAEVLDTPTQFGIDCDFAKDCNFGMVGIGTKDEALMYANVHARWHNAYRDRETATGGPTDEDLDQPILSMSVNEANEWMGGMHSALAAFAALSADDQTTLPAAIGWLVDQADDRLHASFHSLTANLHRQQHEAVQRARETSEKVRQYLEEFEAKFPEKPAEPCERCGGTGTIDDGTPHFPMPIICPDCANRP